MNIELVRPDGEPRFGDIYVPRYEAKHRERFEPGERVIMVDGERWGRTHVTRHGVWGTKYTFEQQNGGTVQESTGFKRPGSSQYRDIEVRSIRKRTHKDGWRPTEDLVLEKARELVAAGKLRHPDVVRRENEAEHARWVSQREARDAEEAAAFRAKAIEALQINDPESSDPRVDAVIAAMKWAQTQ